MPLFKLVLRIVVLTLVGIEVIGCFCINSLMFHPVRQYDAGHPSYVDIGTNEVKIAAIVGGQQKGRKALLYCHGNAEDATELAATKPVGGLVLQAPFLSAPRVSSRCLSVI